MSVTQQPERTVNINERAAWSANGFVAALGWFAGLALIVLGGYLFIAEGVLPNIDDPNVGMLVAGVLLFLAGIVLLSSIGIVQPGTTKVVQFFGQYVGTVRRTGLIMTVPFSVRRSISVRVANFESNELKVNDSDGNPINIAAIIVWQVSDTAKAMFAVEDYEDFVRVQAESALRHVAMAHPYDTSNHDVTSLRGATDEVAVEIVAEVSERVRLAGVDVIEARISKLAYAPEIAQVMLQRQQAGAIIAARELIVEGAVTMVEAALARLEKENIVALDEERKAAMVSNLLVVLCGDSRATPVVNTGTLYT